MGNRSSKLGRESEDSGKSGSGPFSRKLSKRRLPDNSDSVIKYTDSSTGAKIIDRKPLDRRDPWGHMAAVVHSKHGDEWSTRLLWYNGTLDIPQNYLFCQLIAIGSGELIILVLGVVLRRLPFNTSLLPLEAFGTAGFEDTCMNFSSYFKHNDEKLLGCDPIFLSTHVSKATLIFVLAK